MSWVSHWLHYRTDWHILWSPSPGLLRQHGTWASRHWLGCDFVLPPYMHFLLFNIFFNIMGLTLFWLLASVVKLLPLRRLPTPTQFESEADDELPQEGFSNVFINIRYYLFLQELWKVTATPLPFDRAQSDSELFPSWPGLTSEQYADTVKLQLRI